MRCAEPEPSDHERLRRLLRDRLHTRPEPLSLIGEVTIPDASLWNGARCWVDALRAAGLQCGDAVLLHPGHQVALVQAVLAGWWCGLHVEFATAGGGGDGGSGDGAAGATVVDLRVAQGLAGPLTPPARSTSHRCSARPSGATGPDAVGPDAVGPVPPTLFERGEAPRSIDAAAVLEAVASPDAARFAEAVVFVAATDVALSTVFHHVLVPLLAGATAVVWPGPSALQRGRRALIARYDPDVIVPCRPEAQHRCSSGAASPSIWSQ